MRTERRCRPPGASALTRRACRRTQLPLYVTAVLLFAGASLLASNSPSEASQVWPLSPHEQAYATAWGVDPYQDADLHVAMASGRPQAVSFLRFDLRRLPSGIAIDDLTLTLTPKENGQTANAGAPGEQRIVACLATGSFPDAFDPSSEALPWDCSRSSGLLEIGDDATWSVTLTPVVEQWVERGNTGLVLTGVRSDVGVPEVDALLVGAHHNWTQAFDHAKTTAKATYSVVPVSAPADDGADASSFSGGRPLAVTMPTADEPIALGPEAQPEGSVLFVAPVSEAEEGGAAPLWMYAFAAVWGSCATLLAVGLVQHLRTAEGHSLRALLDVVRRGVRMKSTWLAGIPLVLVVFGAGSAVAYMEALNRRVTPPLSFPAEAAPETRPASDDRTAAEPTSDPGVPAASNVSAPVEEGSDRASSVKEKADDRVTAFDGRWVVAANSVAGYRVGYSSPTGRGIRVGRTDGADGLDGEVDIAGTLVRAVRFSVDMRKVHCDGGSTCDEHVGEIMDTQNHPFETFVLTSPIDVGSVPADGESVQRTATGKLTLRGVMRTVTFGVSGRRNGDKIEVLGTINIKRSDYKIPDAEQPGFSIDEDGAIEFLLVFKRA